MNTALASRDRRPPVVVIGAGFGGLCAAIDLARAGLPVTVVEAMDHPGGKAGTAAHDGVPFDTGPSVLTMRGVFASLFADCGTTLDEHVTLFEPAPAFLYAWEDGTTLAVHARWADTLDSIREAFGADAAREAEAFLAYCGRIWAAAEPHFVRGPRPTLGRMALLGMRHPGAVLAIDALHTMERALVRRVRHPRLRDLFRRYATYNGSDVRRAPATLHCIAHVELVDGGWGVQGGMHALVGALVELATRLGVVFRLGERVEGLVQEAGRVTGVSLAFGGHLAARAVVCNADTAQLQRWIRPDRVEPAMAARDRSMSGWTAVVRARRRPRPAHAVLFADGYLREFEDIFDHGRPPATPTAYVCAQEVAHRRRGWEDDEPLFVMANAPMWSEDPAAEDPAAVGARALERLRRAGWIGAGDRVVWERTPADLARVFPHTGGALYGPASNDMFAAFRRTANRHALPGLYVCGGSAHPGGGVPMCALSGRAAAALVQQDQGVVPAPAGRG
jgi:1-hydroxycarotenoid 3,4-desaturase